MYIYDFCVAVALISFRLAKSGESLTLSLEVVGTNSKLEMTAA